MKDWKLFTAFGLLFLLFTRCANPVSLGGGPRDETPPVLITETSTPNYQVRFEKQDIQLFFNEFIQLRDVQRYVIISPPLDQFPEIETKGKLLEIRFLEDELLKENATYVVNFGDAIRDYTESNPIENFRFIFSTGDFIDSLSISGKIVDSYTRQPVKEVFVMLYENTKDSVVYTDRPFYFSSTDDEGNFKIENIRADSFKIFALKDGNLNYLYDQDSEEIGFLDSLLIVTDSTELNLTLEMFTENQAFARREIDAKQFGYILITYTGETKDLTLSSDLDSIENKKWIVKNSGDSLQLWYDFGLDTNFVLYVRDNAVYHDTIRVRRVDRNKFLNSNKLTNKWSSIDRNGAMAPSRPLILELNNPIQTIDTSLIRMYKDTIIHQIDYSFKVDSSDFKKISFSAVWQQDSSYTIQFEKAALTDMFGAVSDSIQQIFTLNNADQYGLIRLSYDSLTTGSQVIVFLKKGSRIISKKIIMGAAGMITWNELEPGKYELEVINDRNSNGVWDPGNYSEKIQSERVKRIKLNDLKANWELEETLDLGRFDSDFDLEQ